MDGGKVGPARFAQNLRFDQLLRSTEPNMTLRARQVVEQPSQWDVFTRPKLYEELEHEAKEIGNL